MTPQMLLPVSLFDLLSGFTINKEQTMVSALDLAKGALTLTGKNVDEGYWEGRHITTGPPILPWQELLSEE